MNKDIRMKEFWAICGISRVSCVELLTNEPESELCNLLRPAIGIVCYIKAYEPIAVREVLFNAFNSVCETIFFQRYIVTKEKHEISRTLRNKVIPAVTHFAVIGHLASDALIFLILFGIPE